MLELIEVSKRYPGQTVPAVENLSLTIGEGEICVLVGPSGCGKSTTLRMINRLIEATSGEIRIDGQDVRTADPDRLRMGIGYVIQQIGLLPHRTIAENIALVPRLYKWPKERIKKRVDELLAIMGLDPEENRDKYPSQLSGGQMQRVGVARAMAVDPPIMLMDEPFGAVDPLVRNRLQDEFLRLQREIKKTIVFVTHDINEAIKMGDKIAIFNEGRLVQHGTPEEILTDPENEFVEDFIGHDRVVKKLNLHRVEDSMRTGVCCLSDSELPGAWQKMAEVGAEAAFLEDTQGHPHGFITPAEARLEGVGAQQLKDIAFARRFALVQADSPLPDALSIMLEYDTECLGVLREGKIVGLLSFSDIRKHVCRREGE
ncbi:glycine betaine/carnitine/choline transport ATP-binding protein OpuCA [Peptococcaceae bacterium CEB3]|nr:glycine betaine/carnitine/choline transport ATP-binding protein OpuCA [Peptococcaceae bacterium CEB3]